MENARLQFRNDDASDRRPHKRPRLLSASSSNSTPNSNPWTSDAFSKRPERIARVSSPTKFYNTFNDVPKDVSPDTSRMHPVLPAPKQGSTSSLLPQSDSSKDSPKKRLVRLKPPVLSSIKQITPQVDKGDTRSRPSLPPISAFHPQPVPPSNSKTLKVPRPPPLLPPSKPLIKSGGQIHETFKSFPIVKDSATTNGRSSSLKPPPRPVTPQPVASTSNNASKMVPVRALAANLKAPPERPPIDTRRMKTISTTRMAQSVNPFTEDGSMGLMAMKLGQTPEIYVDPYERKYRRGLMQSPEKAHKKSKQPRYLSGGLADSARSFFQTHNTSLSMWEQEIERYAHKSGLRPDKRLHVTQIIYSTPPSPSKVLRNPGYVLVHGHLTSTPKILMSEHIEADAGKVYLIKLDPAAAGSKRREISDNTELWVWNPLITVDISNSSFVDLDGLSREIAGKKIVLLSKVYIPENVDDTYQM
ncbi:hypothetical protein C8Q75DRAFT_780185 [Abortiporus biennis]|nr:hypothetical protein C8Q75DRAFT_780185 [Abortiporus biennis]